MRYFKKKHLVYSLSKQSFLTKGHKGKYIIVFLNNGLLTNIQYKILVFFLKKKLKFYSKLYIRINLNFKMTKKSIGVRMGKGKGSLDLSYVSVKRGQIFCEFGFKKLLNDILSFQNIIINISRIKYFQKKVKQIIKLAALKLKIKLKLFKNF